MSVLTGQKKTNNCYKSIMSTLPRALRKEPAMSEKTHYTNAELKILHYLKRHHGTIRSKDGLSVAHRIARDLNMTRVAVVPVLRNLENACVLVRTFAGGMKSAIIRVELIDKDMELPPLPIIPAVNIMVENRELEERIIARSD